MGVIIMIMTLWKMLLPKKSWLLLALKLHIVNSRLETAQLSFVYKNYWVVSDKCIFDATISRSYVLCGATYRRHLSCRKSEKMSSRPDWGAASLLNLFKRYFQQEYFLKE